MGFLSLLIECGTCLCYQLLGAYVPRRALCRRLISGDRPVRGGVEPYQTMFFPGDGRPEDRQQDPIPEFRPLMAVDPSSDDLRVDSSQVKRGKDRSHNHHEDEKPPPCPCPGSGGKEQAQEEDEQRPPDAENQAAAVELVPAAVPDRCWSSCVLPPLQDWNGRSVPLAVGLEELVPTFWKPPY